MLPRLLFNGATLRTGERCVAPVRLVNNSGFGRIMHADQAWSWSEPFGTRMLVGDYRDRRDGCLPCRPCLASEHMPEHVVRIAVPADVNVES